MSNRKLRSARVEFLYLMAREGRREFDSRTEQEVLLPLEKEGLVARNRTRARDPQGSWKGDRRRNTFWVITEKGWLLLRARGNSNDQRIRVHQNNRNVPYYIDKHINNRAQTPLHELITKAVNFPEPGILENVMGRGPSKRREPIRYRRLKRLAR